MIIRHITAALKAATLPVAAFITCCNLCMAMPASRRPIVMHLADGSAVEVLLHGDEYHHAVTTPDGTTLLKRTPEGKFIEAGIFDPELFQSRLTNARKLRAPRRRAAATNFPCSGKQRSIAILVEFPETDKHPQGRRFTSKDPRALFDRLLNSDNYTDDGARGSVSRYFRDSSNGQFEITFDTYGPITLSQDVSHYLDNDGGDLTGWQMAEEACRAIDDQVDFTQYDRDFDGLIDNVYIFYAGPGAATGGDPSDCVWQHAGNVEEISGKQFSFDGVRLNHYACSNEYRDTRDAQGNNVRITEGIGTVCHEFSHVLGLPDLYDVYYAGHNSPGVWDVMDQGCHLDNARCPNLYSALDRMLLDWLEPTVIGTTPATHSLADISNNRAMRINTTDPNEYFLLENRQQKGWDSELPGHGLLVWRINYQPDYWDANQVNTGKGSSHAYIIRADGVISEESLAGDPFPGSMRVTGLTDDGYPNMLTSRGERTNAPISNITEAGGIITFDICRAVTHLDKVTGVTISNLTPTGFTASWDALPMSPGYLFSLSCDDAENLPELYRHLSLSDNTIRVTGLTPSTRYSFTIKGVAGAVEGEESDPCVVTTPPMSFAYTSPLIIGSSDLTHNSFRLSWEPLAEAVDYALSVATVQPGDDRYATIDFTGGIDALPSGWSTNSITTIAMNGYFGKQSPALSLTSDYGRLQSPLLNSDLRSLDFWYRERTGSGKSYIEVDMLVDGSWIKVDSIPLPASMKEGVNYTVDPSAIPSGALGISLIYHRVDKGSLAIDDVKLSYRGEDVTTPIEGWNRRRLDSSATEATVTDLQPATLYHCYLYGINSADEFSAVSEPHILTTLEATSVEDIEVSSLKVTVSKDGVVSVAGSESFSLFDIHGRKIKGCRLESHGIYILKTESETIKLAY